MFATPSAWPCRSLSSRSRTTPQEQQRAHAASGQPHVARPATGADAGSGAATPEAILDARIAAGSDLDSESERDEPAGPTSAARRRRLGEQWGSWGSQQQQPAAAGAGAGAVPWGAFMASPPVWAVTVAHFCFNWGYYTLLAWLPSYFELALGLNVQESSFLTLIP